MIRRKQPSEDWGKSIPSRNDSSKDKAPELVISLLFARRKETSVVRA